MRQDMPMLDNVMTSTNKDTVSGGGQRLPPSFSPIRTLKVPIVLSSSASSAFSSPSKLLKMRDRPSHDLEMALQFLGGTGTAGRDRARTEETDNIESDASSSSDGSSDSDDVDLELGQKPIPKSLFSTLFRPKTAHHQVLVQRIESSDEDDTTDEDDVDILPCEMRRPSTSRLAKKGPPPQQQQTPPRKMIQEEERREPDLSISLPQPQRRHPPSCNVHTTQYDAQRPVMIPSRPSQSSFTPVGSIGGAFTRIHPTLEGVAREVMDVDNQGLRIKWTPLELESQQEDRKQPSASSQNNDNCGSDTDLEDVSSAGETGEDSLVPSLPKMSAIASASAAWHHVKSSSYKNKVAGSVRTNTCTDTSGSISFEDDISVASSNRPPSSLTAASVVRRSQSGCCGCCNPCSSTVRVRILPPWLENAPGSVQFLVLGAVALFFVAFVVFALTTTFAILDHREDDGSGIVSESVRTDDKVFHEAVTEWLTGQEGDEGERNLLESLFFWRNSRRLH